MPAPVITVEPNVFDPEQIILTNTRSVIMNITNWGRIAANDLRLRLPSSSTVRAQRASERARTACACSCTEQGYLGRCG